MSDIHFEIEGKPVPASRPKVSKWGTYYPKNHTVYAKYLSSMFAQSPEYITEEPVEVRILCVMPKYKTSDHPVHRADVDNLSKLPMDGMTKSQRYWKDDDLVVSLVALKRFCRDNEEPHTKIRIVPIKGTPEDWVDDLFYN